MSNHTTIDDPKLIVKLGKLDKHPFVGIVLFNFCKRHSNPFSLQPCKATQLQGKVCPRARSSCLAPRAAHQQRCEVMKAMNERREKTVCRSGNDVGVR